MALISAGKSESDTRPGWNLAQPEDSVADLPAPQTQLPASPAPLGNYRDLIRHPSRVLNDSLYRFLEWLPLHPALSALLFGVALMLPSLVFGDSSNPAGHNRSFTELHSSYFFLPVIVVQVLVMPLFFKAALECFDAMRSSMQCTEAVIARKRQAMIHPGRGLQYSVLAAAVLLGSISEELSFGRFSRMLANEWNGFDVWLIFANITALAMFLWYLAMPVSRTLIIASQLQQTVTPRLFDYDIARPIANFGFRAGMLFAIPYFFVASTAPIFLSDTWTFVWPGVVGALAAVGFSLIPAMPIRRKIRELKKAEIRRVDTDIADVYGQAPGTKLSGKSLSELVTLLDYRREVKALSEWPFEAKFVRGFGLYFLLFPLTWVAAAFVEMIVEQMAT